MQTESTFELSEAEVARFRQRGILTVDFGFDESLLDAVKAGLAPLYPSGGTNGQLPIARVQDAWRRVDACRRLATSSRVRAALKQLYGRSPLPFQTINFSMGSAQAAHSDSIHFNSVPSGFVAGVWVALEDVDERNGALVYYPGTHELPEYTMQSLGLEGDYGDYPRYEEKIRQLIDERGLHPEYGTLRKGMAVIWHGNLLHGGIPHLDRTRSRHSQVTHYFFEGCRYYTPLISRPGRRTYRFPDWIPGGDEVVAGSDESGSTELLRRIEVKLTLYWYRVTDFISCFW